MTFQQPLNEIIIEEIALDGLEGITFPGKLHSSAPSRTASDCFSLLPFQIFASESVNDST